MSSPIRRTASSARTSRSAKAGDSVDSRSQSPQRRAGLLPWDRYALYFGIAIVGAAADLLTKQWVFAWLGLPGRESKIYWLWPDHFGFQTSLNPGALFGMGAGFSLLFAVLSIAAAIGILVWLFVWRAAYDRLLTIALASVTGGILGNLYDRLGLHGIRQFGPEYEHAVRDWILFQLPEVPLAILNPWPNFNIADMLLVGGAALLVVHSFWWQQPEGKKGPVENRDAAEPPSGDSADGKSQGGKSKG